MATTKQKTRNAKVSKRLNVQLKENTKHSKEDKNVLVELSDSDKKRINKEIDILKSRI